MFILMFVPSFWKYVSQPPVKILEIDETDNQNNTEPVVLETPRFMAVVWGAGGHGDGPTTIVQLDGNGKGSGCYGWPGFKGSRGVGLVACGCWCF